MVFLTSCKSVHGNSVCLTVIVVNVCGCVCVGFQPGLQCEQPTQRGYHDCCYGQVPANFRALVQNQAFGVCSGEYLEAPLNSLPLRQEAGWCTGSLAPVSFVRRRAFFFSFLFFFY